jgi:hypothetical protein
MSACKILKPYYALTCNVTTEAAIARLPFVLVDQLPYMPLADAID